MSSQFDNQLPFDPQQVRELGKKILNFGLLWPVLIIVGFGLYSSFYTVEANSQAVILRFGKHINTVEPGAHFKLLRLTIGAEVLELTEILDPGPGARPGRPLPADSQSTARWFQHICLVVNGMGAALAGLRQGFKAGALRDAMPRANGEFVAIFDADFVPDLQPADVDARTRALADVCLVLFNSNEFAYVY